MSNSSKKCDIVIIGSGVIGSALAYALGRDGFQVSIIERDLNEPNRIVGEFLQPGGVLALKELGLIDCLDKISRKMFGFVIHHDDSMINIPFNEHAFVIDNGKFIMALRKKALNESNVSYIQGSASKLIENNGIVEGVEYVDINNEREKIYAKLTLICDGCFSNFRKLITTCKPRQHSFTAGLILSDSVEIKENFAQVYVTNTAPILTYKMDERRTRILVYMETKPRDLYGYLSSIINQLPCRLRKGFLDAIESKNVKVKVTPNFYLPAIKYNKVGVACLGDAMNIRHSLTGCGMTVGFKDAILLRDMLRKMGAFDILEIHESVCNLKQERKKYSVCANSTSMGFYELFSANDDDFFQLKKASLKYLTLSETNIEALSSIITVLDPSIIKMIRHIVSLFFYIIYKYPCNCFKLVRKLLEITIPVFFSEMFS